MIERIITIGTFLAGLCFYFFKKGETKQKNKQNETILKKLKATKKRRDSRSNDTVDDDLKWLLERNND